jgi:DNA-directed RNA polymerase subunit H (RpoH/RPB5)
MEKSVQKIADKLGLPIASVCDKEWQTIINEIRGQLNSLYPKHSDPDRIKHEAILGHLETVKIAWRNPTMHPKATYTDEEAGAVLNTVKIFVKELPKIL